MWDDPAASSEAPLFDLSDLIAAVRSHQPAVAAVVGEEPAGVAVATVTGDQAWVMRISLAAPWRRRGIGSAMLGELERRLVGAGVRRIVCLLAEDSEIGPLICATNSARALDSGFLRHGRSTTCCPSAPRIRPRGRRSGIATWLTSRAISQTRRTLTSELVAEFEQDITGYARM